MTGSSRRLNACEALMRHLFDGEVKVNDVLTRLPTQLNSRVDELLPHN